MADPRVAEYARLLVGRCLDVQPGWQVLVRSTPLARPLHEEVVREIARRGAYALTRLRFVQIADVAWAAAAPLELLGETSAIDRYEAENADAVLTIVAPENTRDGGALPAERRRLLQQASRPLRERVMSLRIRWAVCEYPCPALAQAADMTTEEFADFLYGACLLDWDAEERRLRRIADRFDRASEVRIVGEGTDLTLSIAGRKGIASAGYRNLPDGEVHYAPVEDSASGVVSFSEFAAAYQGNEVEGVRLRFEGGRVVEAEATANERFLLETLDTDEGARALGEFGIGCNPAIQRYTKNVAFDEKMDGTVHLALGASYTYAGGTNDSAVHWDLVKDLRRGGQLWCDGELVQENGDWLLE